MPSVGVSYAIEMDANVLRMDIIGKCLPVRSDAIAGFVYCF